MRMSLPRFAPTSVLAFATTVSLLRNLALGCVTVTLAGCAGNRFEAGEDADASTGGEAIATNDGAMVVLPSDGVTTDTLPPLDTDETASSGAPTPPVDTNATQPPVPVVDAGMHPAPTTSGPDTVDGPVESQDGGSDAVDAASGGTDGMEPGGPAQDEADAGSGTDMPVPPVDAGEPGPMCGADEERGPEGHCYFFSSVVADWRTARAACAARGDDWDLASIESVAEHEWIAERLTADTWMGGIKDGDQWLWASEDTEFWIGEEDGEPVDGAFVHWEVDEPSGATFSDQCMRYSNAVGDWYWADIQCSREFLYLCEQSPED